MQWLILAWHAGQALLEVAWAIVASCTNLVRKKIDRGVVAHTGLDAVLQHFSSREGPVAAFRALSAGCLALGAESTVSPRLAQHRSIATASTLVASWALRARCSSGLLWAVKSRHCTAGQAVRSGLPS